MKKVLTLSSLALLAACASGPKIERSYDYVISDMSSADRPEWLDSEYIVEMNAKADGYKYYVGENDNTASGSSKALCRAAAEAKARYDLAAAIESTIKNAYTEVEAADGKGVVSSASDLDRALYVDKAISGAEKYKDYWEERSHKKDKGAAKDYKSFSCMTLVRIKDDTYANVIQSASDKMVDSFKAPAAAPVAVSKFKADVLEKATAAVLPAPSVNQ